MPTFAQEPKATQQTTSGKSKIPGLPHLGQSPEVKSILHLQRTIGNQVVERMLQTNAAELEVGLASTASPRSAHDVSQVPLHPKSPANVQAKLTVGPPGDIYEEEADRISEQVMRMPEPQLQPACPCGGGCPKCQMDQLGQEHEGLQTKRIQASDTGQSAAPPIVREVLAEPGQPLDPATRAFFGPRFGHDFSHVRMHTDAKAAESARAVNAHAYTVGHNIVFGKDQFAPGMHGGRRLIAHELAHVVQSQGARPAMHRLVRGDIRQIAISREWAELLTPSELKEQAEVATQVLPTLLAGSVEREVLAENLAVLEEVATAKGVELPALIAYSLRQLIHPLVVDVRQLLMQFKAVAATEIGTYSHPLSDYFPGDMKWGVDHFDWIITALLEAAELVARAESGGVQSAEQFQQAGTRYMAALLGAQSMTVWLAYLQTGAAALH